MKRPVDEAYDLYRNTKGFSAEKPFGRIWRQSRHSWRWEVHPPRGSWHARRARRIGKATTLNGAIMAAQRAYADARWS